MDENEKKEPETAQEPPKPEDYSRYMGTLNRIYRRNNNPQRKKLGDGIGSLKKGQQPAAPAPEPGKKDRSFLVVAGGAILLLATSSFISASSRTSKGWPSKSSIRSIGIIATVPSLSLGTIVREKSGGISSCEAASCFPTRIAVACGWISGFTVYGFWSFSVWLLPRVWWMYVCGWRVIPGLPESLPLSAAGIFKHKEFDSSGGIFRLV